MKIAISQPAYLPWCGFFDLIDQVDQFVFLDDAQFVKQSWHHRNRIKGTGALQWLTVPVAYHGKLGQAISEVVIRDPQFAEKHTRSVEVNYGRSDYFEVYFPRFKAILQKYRSGGRLLDLNLDLIEWLVRELMIATPSVRSSSLAAEGKRSSRLVSICKLLGATEYLSPRSADYLRNDLPLFQEAGVAVRFQNYTHPSYEQRFPPFLAQASVLDLLFNEGPAAGDILRSGRRTALEPSNLQPCEAVAVAGV
jgi:hypothetical protein